MSQKQILENLLEKFQKRHLLTVYEAALEIKKKWGKPEAVRSAISRGKFPLPVFPVGGESMVRIGDLATFLADPATTFPQAEETTRRGPGRPPKVGRAA